ncbi:MAG: vesicle coat component [Stictis urceolatum]|nr:vesicle coat component [Stictis urceolata]
MSNHASNGLTHADEQVSWNPALRLDSDVEASGANIQEKGNDEVHIDDGEVAEESYTPIPMTESTIPDDAPIILPHEIETPTATEDQPILPVNEQVAPPSRVESGDDWDAGDRVDPTWGLQSSGASLSHTNSFPPVPPLPESSNSLVQPLAHSQAENILEEVENEDSEIKNSSNMEASQDVWGPEAESKDAEDFFSKVNDLGSSMPVEPSDTEARYEEGVTLLQHETEQPRADTTPSAVYDVRQGEELFESNFENEGTGDDFFNQIGAKTEMLQPVEPPSLDRKSTMQVMSSMEFPLHSANHDEPKEDETEVGGDVGTFGETDGISASKDDLAALWEAALGDDDLLEDEPGMDPSSFFEDDGEGFLEDVPASTQAQATTAAPSTRSYAPQNQAQVRQSSAYQPTNSYALVQAQHSAARPSPYTLASTPNFVGGMSAGYGQHQQLQRPNMGEKAQSFADKSKGGYASPFDAPMDLGLGRPKRRPAQFQAPASNTTNRPPPPPRSSSIQSPDLPPGQPTHPSSAVQPLAPTNAIAVPSRPQPKGGANSFFEELPMAPKARPASRYSQPPAQPTPPPSRGIPTGPPSMPGPHAGAPPQQYNHGLVSPDRTMSFAESKQQSVPAPPGPALPGPLPPRTAPPPNTRYSPAPGAPQQDSTRARYAAAGVPARPPSVTLPHQPRTSSPLARSASASHQYLPQSQNNGMSPNIQSPPSNYASMPLHQSPPKAAPPSRSSYAATPSSYTPGAEAASFDRPAVMQRGLVQEPASISSYPMSQTSPLSQRHIRPRGPSLDVNFILPTDGHERDPLKRWQGAPIFSFGFGGNITVSFPQRVPRFSSGQAAPMIKCTPGPVRVDSAKILPFDEHAAAFPGPLKTKSKKKDVLDWLRKGVQRLEQQHIQHVPQESPVDVRKRHEEKVSLWKILAVMIEHDGMLEGSPSISKAIRDILSPELSFDGPANQLSYSSDMLPTGIVSNQDYKSKEAAGGDAVESLRKLLLQGDREKAVWFAVDQRLWGHAMLIASTMQPGVKKQVAQEFVKVDVKPIGDNTESLAALYDVFSGNWEESVDRLVPPSARAGLQMVSKTAMSGPTKNAFDGLDRWRETLSLILSNRSTEDGRAMIALGQLLSTYGRIEAAHICYIFSRAPGLFGGAEDPQAHIVLIGADHRQQPFDYGRDIDSVLLTEVYDFALSILNNSASPAGHLQPFKLYHAAILADHGLRDEAQHYCDTIASSQKATTKMSSYYHGRLFAALEDLNARLRQAPKEDSGSWISKPSMDKVSSSIFNKFTSFVAGDDSDAASVGSAQHEAQGPFAKINGDTPPTLSRSGSPSDSFGYGSGYAPSAPAPPANSRYAPGNAYSPRTSLDQPGLNRRPSQMSMTSASPDLSRSAHGGYHPSTLSQAMPTSQSEYSPIFSQSRFQSSSQYSARPESQGSQGPISPPTEAPRASPYQPRSSSYQSSPTSSYEPPPSNLARSASYGPRSYQPSPATEKPLPTAPTEEAASYEPQAPDPDMPSASDPQPALQAPTISHEPPTPVKANYETPSYGFEPSPWADSGSPSREISEAGPSGYEPPTSSYEPPSSSYEPPTSSYEPPEQDEPSASSYEPPKSSYEPPSYQPHEPENNGDVSTSPIKKKKSFMDLSDDEADIMARSITLKNDRPGEKSKAEKDREAQEAFRRAAEADAAKDNKPQLQSKGSGWLGGWFSKGNAPAPDSQPKAIKAKLGEQSSFYFDKELGKWVNKNSSDSAAPSAPAPPPPRAPPSRQVSTSSLGANGPTGMKPPTSAPSGPPAGGPPGPASRNVSPSLGSTPPNPSPLGATPNVVPPSRPGTGMSGVSNASSIDDLIGVPQARKGGTMKGKKKRNAYVDVMAKD